MKVTGFTFIKNGIALDYPIVEAIESILPICDDFIVAVGKSEDHTLELIQSINSSKIKIIETIWDKENREGGRVLALETDKAFKAISDESDWGFYIQGDEVIHEQYLETIRNTMLKHKDDLDVDGLLFKYQDFYGSYDYVGISSNWYKHEIRIVKNNASIYSYKDAQGFRKEDNVKLNVVPIDAYVNHYGWVKEPEAMQKKQESFHKLWHDDKWVDENVIKATSFNYESNVNQLKRFEGTHPKVMLERVKMKNWTFDHDLSTVNKSLKDKVKSLITSILGLNLDYKNYKIIKK